VEPAVQAVISNLRLITPISETNNFFNFPSFVAIFLGLFWAVINLVEGMFRTAYRISDQV
jgi:hypothetical protein